ncbi:MAG: zinc-ribbon domain-containing protein [Actinomycetota bacterium]|nr:zinc-ribbon domain-containing protein [Actinomycetota bacterium]
MENENRRTCPSCGAELKEGTSFCTQCGAAVETGKEAAATPPPAPPGAAIPPTTGAPAAEAGAVTVPGVTPVTSKRGKLPLVLGIIGGVLVAGGIVVLVLFLTVWSGGGAGSGDPIGLAEEYIKSLENKDAKAYVDCFEPELLESEDNPFGLDLTREDIEMFIEMGFEMADFEFNGVKLEKESEKGENATVVTSDGTLIMSTFGLEEEIDLSEEPLIFEMVKEGGSWYLAEDPMDMLTGMDMDYEDYEDFDLEDFDLEDFDLEDFDLEDFDLEYYEDMDEPAEEEIESLLEDLDLLA